MTAWSLLEPSGAPQSSQPISNSPEIDALRQDQREVEDAIEDLNRQITAAVVSELQQGSLSAELAAIIEARDRLRARILTLGGTQHG
jgi:hypothetical protein